MADITSFDGLSADELTEEQLNYIILQIDLAITNIAMDRHGSVKYAEFGMGGHSKDTAGFLRELRELKSKYEKQLVSLPFEGISVFDNPDI